MSILLYLVQESKWRNPSKLICKVSITLLPKPIKDTTNFGPISLMNTCAESSQQTGSKQHILNIIHRDPGFNPGMQRRVQNMQIENAAH